MPEGRRRRAACRGSDHALGYHRQDQRERRGESAARYGKRTANGPM